MKLKSNMFRLIPIVFIFYMVLWDLNSYAQCSTIDICIEEIQRLEGAKVNSEQKVLNHFIDKGDDAYDAWRVLYEADPNTNRMSISILEKIEEYLSTTDARVDDVIREIKESGLGFEGWFLQKLTPPKLTLPRPIDELLDNVDYSTTKKKHLEQDLKSSDELAKALGTDEDLLNAWSIFYDIKVSDALRNEVNSLRAMASYVKKIKKENFSFTLESFNRFVKDKLDKSAYVKAILYPIKLYKGIKIPDALLSRVPIVTAKISSSQFSGTGKFGAYEIRIQDGKVQHLVVDSNGKHNWKAFDKGIYDINFVITNDGKLRIGHGHYNLSGESRTVISAGKLIFENGQITEVSNFSGHYMPSIDNLNEVAEVFRQLEITSSDFKVFEKPDSKQTESD
ncbi:hypothetical protein [Flavivirga algicola]|uniref:Uncharacterized protein n=1 Tax=Flavivirga algicola TaxID=2729136 RepID=A0ABX1RQY2_9FLAO|nr:hypothetical protein [Flavivirga algicola]NMH85951.1 hypothetical protein [Flavivirga algicola]